MAATKILTHKAGLAIDNGQKSDLLSLVGRGKTAVDFKNADEIVDFLIPRTRPGDLILVMSNGGFDNIHEKLLNRWK